MDKIIKRSAWRGKWRRFCIECLITRSNSSQTARKLDLFSAAANRGGLGWGRCSFAASHASAEIFIIISHSFFRSSERPVIRRNRCQFFCELSFLPENSFNLFHFSYSPFIQMFKLVSQTLQYVYQGMYSCPSIVTTYKFNSTWQT